MANALAAVNPAERTSADVAVYVEGSPLQDGLGSLHTLVSTVAGEGVWSLMAAQFEQKMGANLLDVAKLQEIGIDANTAWGLAVNMKIPAEADAKPEFTMIIPTQQNSKFYDYLKAKINEDESMKPKEIEPGKLLSFGTENDMGYLLRTDDAVLLGNKLDMVKSMKGRVSSAIASAQYYKSMRAHLMALNGNKLPLVAFYVNPKMIVNTLKMQNDFMLQLQRELNDGDTAATKADENAPFLAEIRDNLQSSGGGLVVANDRVSFYFAYQYKEGYFTDTSKIYPRILQVDTAPLTSDTLAKTPVNYALMKLNVAAIIDLLKSMSPIFTKKYGEFVAKAQSKLNIDFEQQVLATLRNNFNFQVATVPSETKMKDFATWDINGSFGITQGSADGWLRLFKSLEKYRKKAETKFDKKSKFSYDETDDGTFVTIKTFESSGGKIKPITVVFFVRDHEIIVSNSKTNAIKATKGSTKPLTERLARLPYNSAQGVFFLDLHQIYKAVSKSKQGSSLKNYAQMLEKLKSFVILSSIQGEFATAEFTLQMR
ncbi:MAG: hypothetical protein JSR44_11965 [Spirochaetes bacterium]|nr:hypothetical protein [Spirochaetota bacterium]